MPFRGDALFYAIQLGFDCQSIIRLEGDGQRTRALERPRRGISRNDRAQRMYPICRPLQGIGRLENAGEIRS